MDPEKIKKLLRTKVTPTFESAWRIVDSYKIRKSGGLYRTESEEAIEEGLFIEAYNTKLTGDPDKDAKRLYKNLNRKLKELKGFYHAR